MEDFGCSELQSNFSMLKKLFQKNPPLTIVVAMSKQDRALGRDNSLLWHIPDDLKRFKALTSGHPIIMGRKTFESILDILGKPLPNRTNIVVTRDTSYNHDGVLVAHSVEEAVSLAQNEKPVEIHIGGGAQLYQLMLPRVQKLYVTWIDDAPEADTFFPEFEDDFEIIERHPPREHKDISYQWIDYERKRS